MQESELETNVNASRFSRIVHEFRQWREPGNREYIGHYAANILKILFGYEPTDYTRISHDNMVVGSFIPGYDGQQENKVGGAFTDFYRYQGKGVSGARLYDEAESPENKYK